jgi:hypothetical protein
VRSGRVRIAERSAATRCDAATPNPLADGWDLSLLRLDRDGEQVAHQPELDVGNPVSRDLLARGLDTWHYKRSSKDNRHAQERRESLTTAPHVGEYPRSHCRLPIADQGSGRRSQENR